MSSALAGTNQQPTVSEVVEVWRPPEVLPVDLNTAPPEKICTSVINPHTHNEQQICGP